MEFFSENKSLYSQITHFLRVVGKSGPLQWYRQNH